MLNAHRSLALIALALTLAACTALAGADVNSPGTITVAHETTADAQLMLLVQSARLYGPPHSRDAHFTFVDLPPDAEDVDGAISYEGGPTTIFHRVAGRGRPPLAVNIAFPSTCTRLMVAGTVTPSVARVRVLRADGHATPIRLRAAPSGWRYRGRYFGAFLRTASPPLAIRAFDRDGRLLGTVRLGAVRLLHRRC